MSAVQKNAQRMEYHVTTFYKFTQIPGSSLAELQERIESVAADLNMGGLLLLATEGINATIAGTPDAVMHLKAHLEVLFGELQYKDSSSDTQPFKRFKVSIREEIVQLRRTDIQPSAQSHLSPREWDELMADDAAVVIDVRNWYETKLGSFKGAIDPDTEKFSDFPEWVKKSNIPQHKRIGIFCTGGIRCEKAAVAMEELGYTNVHQLDGGVLNYIEKRPNKSFEGECFVFDHRMSVDQRLKPSTKYGRCPHCGNAGDIARNCDRCKVEYKTCADCEAQLPRPSCSKRCRNELRQGIETAK